MDCVDWWLYGVRTGTADEEEGPWQEKSIIELSLIVDDDDDNNNNNNNNIRNFVIIIIIIII